MCDITLTVGMNALESIIKDYGYKGLTAEENEILQAAYFIIEKLEGLENED